LSWCWKRRNKVGHEDDREDVQEGVEGGEGGVREDGDEDVDEELLLLLSEPIRVKIPHHKFSSVNAREWSRVPSSRGSMPRSHRRGLDRITIRLYIMACWR
jgi:hypothetical protein